MAVIVSICGTTCPRANGAGNWNLSPVRELVSLQRRCAANLNQVAIHANTYGVYPAALQKDYAELWGRVSDVLKQLTAVVEL